MPVPIQFKRFHHFQICIPAGKEDEARRFYAGILGLKEIPKAAELAGRGGLWFEMADVQLHLGIENVLNSSRRHPAFEVENISSARKHLENQGVKIRDEIQVPGQMRFSFFDPFGNRIELLQRDQNSSK